MIVQIARKRCMEYRCAFMADVLQYPTDCLVFLDETGCDNNQIRKHGYSTPVYCLFLNRGTRISTICAISQEGLLC